MSNMTDQYNELKESKAESEAIFITKCGRFVIGLQQELCNERTFQVLSEFNAAHSGDGVMWDTERTAEFVSIMNQANFLQ